MNNEPKGNKETILDVALNLFTLRGYDAVGVQELCAASAISKPTLYHYFGSKHGILNSIMDTKGRQLFRIVEADCEYDHDLVMNLTALTRDVLQFAKAQPIFFRLYLALSVSAPESEGFRSVSALRNDIDDCVRNLFNAAVTDHGNMRGREQVYSETFTALLGNRALAVVNHKFEISDASIHQSVHQFMHGIFS